MLGSLLSLVSTNLIAGVACWLLFWFGISHVDSIPYCRCHSPSVLSQIEARERLAAEVLANWNKKDLQDLVRLMRRFADGLLAWHT